MFDLSPVALFSPAWFFYLSRTSFIDLIVGAGREYRSDNSASLERSLAESQQCVDFGGGFVTKSCHKWKFVCIYRVKKRPPSHGCERWGIFTRKFWNGGSKRYFRCIIWYVAPRNTFVTIGDSGEGELTKVLQKWWSQRGRAICYAKNKFYFLFSPPGRPAKNILKIQKPSTPASELILQNKPNLPFVLSPCLCSKTGSGRSPLLILPLASSNPCQLLSRAPFPSSSAKQTNYCTRS